MKTVNDLGIEVAGSWQEAHQAISRLEPSTWRSSNPNSRDSHVKRQEVLMPEIENFNQSHQHCFEVAKATDSLHEDIALEAFELLTTNQYDHFAAHALGVSL